MMMSGSVPVDGGHLRLRLFIYQKVKECASPRAESGFGWMKYGLTTDSF